MNASEWVPMVALAVAGTTPLIYLGVYARRRRRAAARLLSDRPPLDSHSFARTYFLETGRRFQVARDVRDILARHYPLPLEGLRPDDELVRDLRLDDLDSLASVEIALELEGHYGVKLPAKPLQAARTFRDLVDIVESSLDDQSK